MKQPLKGFFKNYKKKKGKFCHGRCGRQALWQPAIQRQITNGELQRGPKSPHYSVMALTITVI